MTHILLKTANQLGLFALMPVELRCSRNDNSSGNWWKYAVAVLVGSSATYFILKGCKKYHGDNSFIHSLVLPSEQCACKNESEPVAEEEETVKSETEDTPAKAEDAPVSGCANESEDFIGNSSARSVNERIRKAQLPYPLLFSSVPNCQQAKVIQELARQLQAHYLQCTSLNFFYYVFGGKGLPCDYMPNDEDRIDFLGTPSELRYLILSLYRPEGKRSVNRGTWPKVEECFLLNGKPIRPGSLKEQTNKIPDNVKIEMTGILSKVYVPTSKECEQAQSNKSP